MLKGKIIRIVIYCLICILLIAAALYHIPWPTRINSEFNSTLVFTDGSEMGIGKVTVCGWQFDYLFQSGKIDVDISFPEEYDWFQPENHNFSFFYDLPWVSDCPYIVSECFLVQRDTLDMGIEQYALSVQDGLFILHNTNMPDTPYLVGSVEADYKASEIMEYFAGLVGTWPD